MRPKAVSHQNRKIIEEKCTCKWTGIYRDRPRRDPSRGMEGMQGAEEDLGSAWMPAML